MPGKVCRSCGLPLARPGLCPDCTDHHPSYKVMRSWSVFEGPIRNALHQLKYRRNLALGEVLARQLVPFARGLGWPVQVVVPVPLGRKRLRERGYNQVSLVAYPLAELGGWEYAPRVLKRVRDTRSQVGLSPAERRENVAGAFTCAPQHVRGRSVLLIDDVATTGATLASCSETLLESGAREVYALTIARALPRHGYWTV
jgi:competence protein ComFC